VAAAGENVASQRLHEQIGQVVPGQVGYEERGFHLVRRAEQAVVILESGGSPAPVSSAASTTALEDPHPSPSKNAVKQVLFIAQSFQASVAARTGEITIGFHRLDNRLQVFFCYGRCAPLVIRVKSGADDQACPDPL
jgi:hypothetical protein